MSKPYFIFDLVENWLKTYLILINYFSLRLFTKRFFKTQHIYMLKTLLYKAVFSKKRLFWFEKLNKVILRTFVKLVHHWTLYRAKPQTVLFFFVNKTRVRAVDIKVSYVLRFDSYLLAVYDLILKVILGFIIAITY